MDPPNIWPMPDRQCDGKEILTQNHHFLMESTNYLWHSSIHFGMIGDLNINPDSGS
jgi:hypothetical protein